MGAKYERPRRYEKAETQKLPNGRILDMGKIKALYRAGWNLDDIALDVHGDVEIVREVLQDAGML